MGCIGDNDSTCSIDENACDIKTNRKCTDKAFLIILILSLIALSSCLGFCFNHGDLDRIINGYDDCGNICGKSNIKTASLNFECYGKNMKEKKYLHYRVANDFFSRNRYIIKECVNSCNVPQNNYKLTNRCFDSQINTNDDISELYKIIQSNWEEITLMFFFAMFLSFAMMLMFRYKTGLTITIILLGFSILCIGVTIFLWVRLSKINKIKEHPVYIKTQILSIVATVFTCILVFIIIAMGKRLTLIIAIFKESAKALADMPLLYLQPFATFLTILFIIICGIYTTLWLSSSGYLKKLNTKEIDLFNRNPRSLDYESSYFDKFTIYFNYFIITWMINLVVACQNIIVAGSVATWFFTRDKSLLESPIQNSIYNLFRYHLGTVCVGSLIISIVSIIKAIVRCLKTTLNNKDSILACVLYCFLKYILDLLELFLKFFSRNAYIQTAIHGYSFCKAGKRAFTLLVNNIFQVIVINSVGDYILTITKLFVAVITMLLSALLLWSEDKTNYMMSTLMIIGFTSFFIAHSFLAIYEMAIDTIFLCFCEDCEVNDGITKQFFMSKNLMEIVTLAHSSTTDLHFSDTVPKRELTQ